MAEIQYYSINQRLSIIAIATVCNDKRCFSCLANMIDRASPPTNNGSINYSTHLWHTIQTLFGLNCWWARWTHLWTTIDLNAAEQHMDRPKPDSNRGRTSCALTKINNTRDNFMSQTKWFITCLFFYTQSSPPTTYPPRSPPSPVHPPLIHPPLPPSSVL